MKKSILVTMMSVLFTYTLFAKIITVSNNPNSPGQYSNLDSAIAAANPGDILLLSGSVTDYNTHGNNGGSITITKPLILYGQGYDPRKDQALASTIGVVHFTAASAGTILSGFSIGNIFMDLTNSITISRCRIGNFGYFYGGNGGNGLNGTNFNLRENIIAGSIPIVGNSADILIENNILGGNIGCPSTVTGIKIYNNYFTGVQTSVIYNAAIYNNIFYFKSASPTSSPYISSSTTNCIFRNNLYFNTTNANPLQIGVNLNSGDSNIINVNPAFVNIDLTSTAVTRADNFNLQPGSPAINTGVSGATDIGPEGGSVPIQYPYSGAPAIPQIKSMNILNPVISPKGSLNVTFKAVSNN